MLQIIFIVAAIAAPFLTWGLTDADYRFRVIPKAVSDATIAATDAEHARATEACNARVAAIQQQLAEKAAEARRLADEAERSVGPTPVEKAELQDLCNRNASCRDRNKETKP